MNSVKKRISLCPNNFVKITHYACFFECSDKGRENWNALRPRGPFLFRSAGKGSKRGRFARHFGSLLFISHVGTRSASLPKLARSRGLKHMERLVFCCCACYGYAQQQKIPSRATQSDSAGAAGRPRQRPVAHGLFIPVRVSNCPPVSSGTSL